MWINYQFMAVCPLILNLLHISSQKWLVFANYFGLPKFLPQLPNFFTRIYPSYPWHFPTLFRWWSHDTSDNIFTLNPGLLDANSHDRLFGQPTPAIVRKLRRIEMGREDGRKVNSKKPLPGKDCFHCHDYCHHCLSCSWPTDRSSSWKAGEADTLPAPWVNIMSS